MELKELRKSKALTQKECSEYLGIPLRTYKMYENDITRRQKIKYDYMIEKLAKYGFVDEEHGILTISVIREKCKAVFVEHKIEYCYLFGSYAKENANETSDVDLLIGSELTGLKYFELVESLREVLKKKVDALDVKQLNDNPALLNEILKDGIKIYG